MVAGSRGHYNASVRDYDTARKVFPTSIIAGMFNFEDREYFEVDTVEVRQAPNVSFE
jgi:LemA protein